MGLVRNDFQIIHPIKGMFSVTPNDSNFLIRKTRAIMVGTTGDVRVLTAQGEDEIMPSLIPGTWHTIEAVRVYSTNTTATQIKGGY